MNHDPLYDIFHFFSRFLIIVPIAILIIGLIMRFSEFSKPAFLSNVTTKPTVTMTVSTTVVTPAVQLNLQGPFVCRFSSPEATVSAYIKDKNVAGTIQMRTGTNKLLLKNDCFYIWTSTSVGQKTCGLSPYISLLQTIPINGLLSGGIPSGMLDNLGIKSTTLPIKPGDITVFMNSCKKQDIQDMSVFMIPKNIMFKEQKIQ